MSLRLLGRVCVAAAVGALLISGVPAAGGPALPAATTAALPLAGRVVALDPGHQLGNRYHPVQIRRQVFVGTGRKDCNTTGTSTDGGYPESRFTLAVALLTRARLQALGATVRLTRTTEDRDLYGPCVDARGRFGARVSADLMISIHGDGTSSWLSGFHVIRPGRVAGLTDDVVRPSRRLQEAVRAQLRATGLRPADYAGGTGAVTRTDLGTLNLSDVPAVMVELGNMRNAADAARMTSRRGQARYADALARGAADFLRARPAG